MLNIILFGPPGSGKGTQSAHIVERYSLVHLSTGDVFRFNIKNNTELGILAKSFMSQGDLVPDEVTIKMLQAEVEKHPDAKGFIFDGFPRTIAQAEALDEFLGGMNEDAFCFELQVPEEELKSRLKKRAETSGRTDDAKSEVIQNRIEVYRKETAPVAAHYKNVNKHSEVNGLGTMEEIAQRLVIAINDAVKING
ncbi:MAG: adenylate kinase [Flavobacteriales bacterium]